MSRFLCFILFIIYTVKSEFEVLLINLDKRQDKLRIAEFQFKKLKLSNYTRISGIDGEILYEKLKNSTKNVSDILAEKYFRVDRTNIHEWNSRHVGCTLSHLKAMKYIIDNNVTRPVLVFEDDFLADGDAFNKLTKALKKLPVDWGLFYAGHCYSRSGKHFKDFDGYTINKLDKNLVPCAHAFVINGAKYASQFFEVGNTAKLGLADFIVQQSSMSRYILYPYLFSQLRAIKADVKSGGGVWRPMLNQSLSDEVSLKLKEGYFNFGKTA